MIDHHEIFLLPLRVNSLVAYTVLELDNFPDLRVDEFSLRFHELFALFGGGIKETRVDLTADML